LRFEVTTVLLLILTSVPLANALEDCADFFVVSYNQQKLIQSLLFDSGNPSTITLKSMKQGAYYWFPQDHNESNTFDVVVREPYGFLKQGEILFKEYGELKWFSKEKGDKVYYNCSAEKLGLTDWFTFEFLENKQIELSDGSTITANFTLVSSNNASNAFTFPDETVGSEFLVLTENVVGQNLVKHKSGTVFYKTKNGYSYIATSNGYPRIQYVGCCATRVVPTLIPTPSPSPTPSASLLPTPSPSLTPSPSFSPSQAVSPAASLAPSPSPSPQQQFDHSGITIVTLQQFDYSGIIIVALAVIILAAIAVFSLITRKK